MTRASRLLLTGIVLVAAIALAAPAIALAETARVGIDTTDSPDPVTAGETLTYTLSVTNSGPDAATAVRVVDTLPAHVDFGSAVPSQGSCTHPATRRVVCTLEQIENAAGATVTVEIVPRKEGRIENQASVNAQETDPNTADNTSVERTKVVAPVIVNCAGRRATVVGTDGDDQLSGTPGADVIAGLAGNDSISGLGGDDVVCGSGGNDTIAGEAGRDTVRGGGGDDRVRGGDGADNLRGKGGLDHLTGGAGGDVLRGGGGIDVCRGGPGSDVKRSC